MNELLVGADGSPDARTALRWATGIARALDLRLRVVQAWQYPSDAILSLGRIELPSRDRAEEQLAEQLQQLVAEDVVADDVDIVIEVARGPAADVLLRAIGGATRMVVVGSRGLGGFKGLLLGSVSRQLIEHATCPVTVIGPNVAAAALRPATIVVGLDGSTHAQRALDFAADLASHLKAELVVTNAVPPDTGDHLLAGDRRRAIDVRRDLVEEWCGSLRGTGVDHRSVVVEGDARTALLEVARDRRADLLVVGSRGLGPVAKLLLGSVASSVAQYGELPVTIVPHVLRSRS